MRRFGMLGASSSRPPSSRPDIKDSQRVRLVGLIQLWMGSIWPESEPERKRHAARERKDARSTHKIMMDNIVRRNSAV